MGGRKPSSPCLCGSAPARARDYPAPVPLCLTKPPILEDCSVSKRAAGGWMKSLPTHEDAAALFENVCGRVVEDAARRLTSRGRLPGGRRRFLGRAGGRCCPYAGPRRRWLLLCPQAPSRCGVRPPQPASGPIQPRGPHVPIRRPSNANPDICSFSPGRASTSPTPAESPEKLHQTRSLDVRLNRGGRASGRYHTGPPDKTNGSRGALVPARWRTDCPFFAADPGRARGKRSRISWSALGAKSATLTEVRP